MVCSMTEDDLAARLCFVGDDLGQPAEKVVICRLAWSFVENATGLDEYKILGTLGDPATALAAKLPRLPRPPGADDGHGEEGRGPCD